MSVRTTPRGTVQVRTGGVSVEHDRVVLCAGRGTVALARTAGLALPVRQAAHVRLSFPVRGEPRERLACLLDGSGAFADESAYGDPLPGNRGYAVGLGETLVREDGSLLDADALADTTSRITAYVSVALPGLDAQPFEARHCWVTELPWNHDGLAVWELDGLLVLAGNNLFKHAPALGRALARAAVGEEQLINLRPEARVGAPSPGLRMA
jgi:sarcosine oxidase